MNIIENNDFGSQGFSGRLKETQEAQAGSREAPGSSRRLKSSIFHCFSLENVEFCILSPRCEKAQGAWISLRIIENHWKSLKICEQQGKQWKSMKISENHWKSMKINEILTNQWKSLNHWKLMKMIDNRWMSLKIMILVPREALGGPRDAPGSSRRPKTLIFHCFSKENVEFGSWAQDATTFQESPVAG